MAQQGSTPSNRGGSREDRESWQRDDDDRSRRNQPGGSYGDDQQSAYSGRSQQMGDYYTGSDRNYGGSAAHRHPGHSRLHTSATIRACRRLE